MELLVFLLKIGTILSFILTVSLNYGINEIQFMQITYDKLKSSNNG